MARTPILSALLFLQVAALHSARAQEPEQTPESRSEAVVGDLEARRWVRLVTPGFATLEGRLTQVSPSMLVLSRGDSLTSGAPLLRIPAAEIDSLWVRGNSARRGAILGSLIGVVGGVGLGAFVESVCSNPDCSDGEGATVGLGVGGLVGGALIGAAIGAAIPRWHRRLPAD